MCQNVDINLLSIFSRFGWRLWWIMRVFILLLDTVLALLRCIHIGPAFIFTYTREELLKFNHTKKPNWVNRQLIFRRRLWLPRDQRTTCLGMLYAVSPPKTTVTGFFTQDNASCSLSTNRSSTVKNVFYCSSSKRFYSRYVFISASLI